MNNIIYFTQYGKITQGRIMTTAKINIGNRQNVLFYTVQKSNGSVVSVDPQQVVSLSKALNFHLTQKVNFEKLKTSIANIKEIQNLPSNVRKIILQKINKKLAVLYV